MVGSGEAVSAGGDPPNATRPSRPRSFYRGTVAEFLSASPDEVIGQMARRLGELHGSAEHEQMRAWRRQIELLTVAFQSLGADARSWSVLFETPLLRLGRRIDVVVLAPGVVAVVEFKIGSMRYDSQDVAQAEYYTLCLRDFHEASRRRVLVPILCADQAPRSLIPASEIVDGVAATIRTNGAGLLEALTSAAQYRQRRPAIGFGASKAPGFVESPADFDHSPLDAEAFERSPYRPTPMIIEAARALYAGHSVVDIGRGDASAEELRRAGDRLAEIVTEARDRRERVVCFVTGTPGAGKTLLGLDLALKSRIAGGDLPPASLLSGNPPLVHVLTEALAHDAHVRRGLKKPVARHEARSAIQGLLGFLREHTDGAVPPEHVLVFDEAQRAWDAEIGLKLLDRRRSEPALFLEIMSRKDWCCLICLVGPGQEINRGEGGLPLWGEALAEAVEAGGTWCVWAAPQAAYGGPDVGGAGLFAPGDERGVIVQAEPLLHLANALRSYRSPEQIRWVSALLDGDLTAAATAAAKMEGPPALLSRDLAETKAWLKLHRRGGRSAGLLVSSGAVRLTAEGLLPAPRSNELDAIAHWFLKSFEDYRSASAVETPLSEFGCQGLELDYAGVCWGGDLIWKGGAWMARSMAAPRWRAANSERRQFRLNAYRVLLTRARAGTVIYVPRGEAEDATRSPAEFDAIAEALVTAGCRPIKGD